jgi:hypothetical protein
MPCELLLLPLLLLLPGFLSWVAWRSAYLTRLGTIRARLLVAFDWTITLLWVACCCSLTQGIINLHQQHG